MQSRQIVFLLAVSLVVVLCLAAGSQALAGDDKAPRKPGTYEEIADVDRVELVEPFKLSSYTTLVVPPVDGSEVKLPDRDDNTYRPVKVVLACAGAAITAQLADILGERVKIVSETPKSTDETLILRMKITEMNPGSRAARMWVGMGAGRANVEIEGELVDAKSDKVLLKFGTGRAGLKADEYEATLIAAVFQNGDDIGNLLALF
jgi:hypothetical protein